MTLRRDLDPLHAVDRVQRGNARVKGGNNLLGHLVLSGAGVVQDARTAALEAAERPIAHRVVRRLANRHGCPAPARVRALLAVAARPGPADAVAAATVAVVLAHPTLLCPDPAHAEDAEAARQALEVLGLRERREPATKECTRCGQTKRPDDFRLKINGTNLRQAVCRQCHIEHRRAAREEAS